MVSEANARSSLQAIKEACFEGFAGGRLGVANGLRRDGSPLDPNGTHPLEVWTGINFGLAAYYRLMGETSTALAITQAVVNQVYEGACNSAPQKPSPGRTPSGPATICGRWRFGHCGPPIPIGN